MGIVNVTPDSFSDGGKHSTHDTALAHALRLIEEGADILDIGGESTRPGAAEVTLAEELERVIPLIESLVPEGVPLSVDTSKPEVMRAALDAGAAIINDVHALQAPGAVDAVAASDCGVVLMHMQGVPRTMQMAPRYEDVVAEVRVFLRERLGVLEAGASPPAGSRSTPDSVSARRSSIISRCCVSCSASSRWAVRWSSGCRASRCWARSPAARSGDRATASVVGAVLAAERGARVLRVHDVAATRDGLRVWEAMQGQGETR